MGIASAATAALGLVLAGPSGASVIVGTPDPFISNCLPFSCGGTSGVRTVQQLYSASAFPGMVTIDQVSFFQKNAGTLDTATYHVTFWQSSRSIGELSQIFAENRGDLLSDFGVFSLSGPSPARLTLTGARFVYDPALSNLLMQVEVSGFTQSGGFSATFQQDVSNSTDRTIGTQEGRIDPGLVTEFRSVGAPVPEPRTWAMLLAGFFGIGAAARRARRDLPGAGRYVA